MIIVANTGLNVSPAVVARYGLHITRQQIIADGVSYDAEALGFAEIDRLVAASKAAPHYLGTSAAEYVKIFTELTKRDREILVISGSHLLTNSYDSAVAAARTLQSMLRPPLPRIDVVNTLSTDGAAGLIVAVAADAATHGHNSAAIVDGVSAMAAGVQTLFVLGEVERFAKGGRAGESRADLERLGGKKPILGLIDGAVRALGVLDDVAPMRSFAAYAVQRVGKGRKVLVAAAHDGNTAQIDELVPLLQRDLDVQAIYCPRMAAAVYLNLGASAVSLGVLPLDVVPWQVGEVVL